MKNETIGAVAAVIVIVLGLQTYMVFKLNDRLNQLSGQTSQTDGFEFKIPKLPKLPPLPKPDADDANAWNPYDEMQRIQNEMEKMFGDSFSRFHMHTPLGSLNKTPDVDLQEKADRYVVTVNTPGADESSLEVKLDNQRLLISIKTEQTKEEADDKQGSYQYRERFVGEFQRVIMLPGPADAAKMTTDYRNGVLTITIPKK